MKPNIWWLIITAIVLIYICKDKIDSFINKKSVCNDIDGRCYDVVIKYDPRSHQVASEKLAKLNVFSLKLLRYMRDKYLINKTPTTPFRYNMVLRMQDNYSPNSIVENDPPGKENTSYVEDKGMVYAVCLRERQTGRNKFHEMHTLEFVMMHEMAHLSQITYGHGNDFWAAFKVILQEAKQAGLHSPTNYMRNPVQYCGIKIDYSPYYDKSLRV